MKKSKIKMLAASACLALIGTASAAWVYAGTATASANIGVKVASYADAGTITVTGADKIKIVLDKNEVKYETLDGFEKLSAKHNVPADFASETKTVTKTFEVWLSPGLTNYVEFGKGVEFGSYSDGSMLYNPGTPLTWEDDKDVFEKLPALAWFISNGKDTCPTNESEYKELINKIQPGTITDDNWSTYQNTTWDATSLNSDLYLEVIFMVTVTD